MQKNDISEASKLPIFSCKIYCVALTYAVRQLIVDEVLSSLRNQNCSAVFIEMAYCPFERIKNAQALLSFMQVASIELQLSFLFYVFCFLCHFWLFYIFSNMDIVHFICLIYIFPLISVEQILGRFIKKKKKNFLAIKFYLENWLWRYSHNFL